MSLNLHCKLVLPEQLDETIYLIQVSSIDTDLILGQTVEVHNSKKTKNKVRAESIPYGWRDQARRYLQWVFHQMGNDSYRQERKKIGRAWRLAEDLGGRLVFSKW